MSRGRHAGHRSRRVEFRLVAATVAAAGAVTAGLVLAEPGHTATPDDRPAATVPSVRVPDGDVLVVAPLVVHGERPAPVVEPTPAGREYRLGERFPTPTPAAGAYCAPPPGSTVCGWEDGTWHDLATGESGCHEFALCDDRAPVEPTPAADPDPQPEPVPVVEPVQPEPQPEPEPEPVVPAADPAPVVPVEVPVNDNDDETTEVS